MQYYMYLFLLMVLLFFFMFNVKTHFLPIFLILKAMMLTTLVISLGIMSTLQYCPYLYLVLLTFAVVEPGLPLSLLLTYIKMVGSDMILTPMF
uniref:NADH dehydrogenase subunit 4L n=1 Tax=Pliciphaedusa aff. tosana RM-2016 TaxID=1885824 RepID=A0A224ABS2_9EUPU|nr:NADH dehydrogenase subunit 4L [Pliciphaedusa aff. tosana RM-2016]